MTQRMLVADHKRESIILDTHNTGMRLSVIILFVINLIMWKWDFNFDHKATVLKGYL
jgi:hypothetical protein